MPVSGVPIAVVELVTPVVAPVVGAVTVALWRRRRWRWWASPPAGGIPAPSATSVAITEDRDDAAIEFGPVELAHCIFEVVVAAKLREAF